MISIKNLTKVYKSKKGCPCTALNDVSFNLADKGMVFILGKSGSGKSTLLNILGGLDNATSGEIIMGGNSFSSFTESDYANYRNSFVGFVFQDFCLIEGFTVRENILISLDIQGKNYDTNLENIATKLELNDLLDRYPKEISGGQKQRVAIARALIKNPELILADEPTGNLDSLSAKQVLETLAKISKEKLVLVVSHNPDDAENYADRIIEIADGKIISDRERNLDATSEVIVTEEQIIIPDKQHLSDEDLIKINETIKKGGCTITQSSTAFLPTNEKSYNTKKVDVTLSQSKIKTKKSIIISYSFLKKKFLGFILSVTMVSLIIIMFGLCQLFSMFNETETLNRAIRESDSKVLVLQKGYIRSKLSNKIQSDELVEITDSDVDALRQAGNGYTGGIYKLYNSTLCMSSLTHSIEMGKNYSNDALYENLYAHENLGVLVCDEEYLINIFGTNGKLNYLAVAEDCKSAGLTITDYVADCILYYQPSTYPTYQHLVGSFYHQRGYINAIIDTGYKNKYQEEISKYSEILDSDSPYLQMIEYKASEEYIKMIDDFNVYYNLAYSTNPNFIEESNKTEFREFARLQNADIYTDDGKFFYVEVLDSYPGQLNSFELQEGEIIIPIEKYNSFFKTSITDVNDPSFQTRYITIKMYPSPITGERICNYEKTFKVVGLHQKHAFFNENDLNNIRAVNLFPYALYFDNIDNAVSLTTKGEELHFFADSGYFKSISSIAEIVAVFKDLFLLIAICLCIAGVLVLVSFGFSNVRKRTYEIGILRALGANMKDVSLIFILQVILAGILICIISTLGLYFATMIANNILSDSFTMLFESAILKDLKIITFNPIALTIDLVVVVVTTFVSAFAPIIAISKVKPLTIIRKKD